MARSLGREVDGLVRALCAFEPGAYSGEDCARLVTKFARAEKALAAARVRAAGRATECNEHRREGFADASEWLSRHTGTTAREARGQLDTMQRLERCPATRDAVHAGEVSLDQADEITRTEAEVPGSEAALVELAKRSGLSRLRDEARTTRVQAIPAEDLHQRQRAARSVRHWRDALGMITGTFRLTPDIGVPVVNRLERQAQRLRRAAQRRGETAERFEAYAADAFAEMLPGRVAPATSKRRDIDAVLVCDLRAYRRGHAHEGEPCHLVGGGPIPVRLAREIANDAFLKAVLHDGVHLHTVKHFGRHIPTELRTALESDHDQPFSSGGPTSYENLNPKCEPHHWDKTERDRRNGRHRGRKRKARPPPRE